MKANNINEDFFPAIEEPVEAKGAAWKRANKKGDKKDSGGYNAHISKKDRKILKFFKNPNINNASFAYKLWPEKDKDNARSLFSKCLNNKKNDNGGTYSFDTDEITKLSNLATQVSSLSECELKYIISETIKQIL